MIIKFRINIIQAPDFILITSGVLYVYFQYSNFEKIVYHLTGKKIDSFTHEIFFAVGIIALIRFFWRLYIFFNCINDANQTTLLNSKSLFIVMVMAYIIFILTRLFPTIILLYQHIKHYKLQTTYFYTLKTLSILLMVKIGLEVIQILFLDYLRFLLKNTYLAYIAKEIQADSDTMITIITMFFTPLCHIYVLHFLTKTKKIIEKNYNYTLFFESPYRPQELLSIRPVDFQAMLYNDYTLKNLIKKLIKEEIHIILNNYPYNIEIIEIDKTSKHTSFELFLHYNKIIYYNDLYDLLEASKITECNSTKYDTEKSVMGYCQEHNIKLAVAILDPNTLIGMILIKYTDEKSLQKNICQSEIKKIINISKIIHIINNVHSSETIKKKFQYKEQLQEYNLLEQKEIYAKKYDKIKNNFLNISIITTREEKNVPIKILLPKENTSFVINFNSYTHKQTELEELQYFTHEENNIYYSMVAAPKMQNRDTAYRSFLIVPGTKLQSNKISYIIEENNIEKIFPVLHENQLQHLHAFYFSMLYGHKIKIIIAEEWHSNSMKAITQFTLENIEIKNIYLTLNLPIHSQLDDLLSFLKEFPQTIFCIFGIDLLSINQQHYFFYQYTNLCITQQPKVKIYLILHTTKKLTLISQDIQNTGQIIIHPICTIEMFSFDTVTLFLQNYNNHILKKKYTESVIDHTLEIIFEKKKKMKLYQFIHYFFDIIESKAVQYIDKNDSETIKHALQLGRKTLKNYPLMNDLKRICMYNKHQIASLLEVEISTINKYFKKKK
jgi:hypothetical protein